MSLHKAQGTTLHGCATCIAHVFDDNMCYMAFSGVIDGKGLHLLDKLCEMTMEQCLAWVQRNVCRLHTDAVEFHMRTPRQCK